MKTSDASRTATPAARLTRRQLLRGGAALGGATALSAVAPRAIARAERPAATTLVVIELGGGNDALNTVVPLQLPSYASRRGTLALPASACLPLTGGPAPTRRYGLHPALPGLHRLWNRGELAFVHKVGVPNATFSHFLSQDAWHRAIAGPGQVPGVARSGWIARYADNYAAHPLGAVRIGNGRSVAFMGGRTPLVQASRLANYALYVDPGYWANHEHRLQTVQTMLNRPGPPLAGAARQRVRTAWSMLPRVQAALAQYPGNAAAYPGTEIGKSLADAAVLLAASPTTRVVLTSMSGFDTHSGQGTTAGRHAARLAEFDAALTAFADDLRAIGLWQRVLVIVTSEFGRKIQPNAAGGTDHGDGGVVLAAGGRVVAGQHGPDLGDAELALDALPSTVDYRAVLWSALSGHLGMPRRFPVLPQPWADPHRLRLVRGG